MKNMINIKNRHYLILFILIFLVFISSVIAKYFLKTDENFLYNANAFYFESDLLSENTNQKSYTLKKGVDYIEFSLKNNIDELRYSDVTITYTVKITDIDGNAITDKSNTEIIDVTGTLTKDDINSQKIRFDNLKAGVYLVTAISTKPYKKQIQANFILSDNDNEINYEVNDAEESPILNLIVSTQDYAGNVKISWPDDVAPDNTDSNFANVDTGYSAGNVTVNFNSNSQYIFRFFKKASLVVYDETDFLVERSD